MIEVLRELADKIQVLECQTLDLQSPFSCWAQLARGAPMTADTAGPLLNSLILQSRNQKAERK